MDRSMYGKFVPGSLNPYQCSIKRGTSPGCERRSLKKHKKIPIYIVENHNEIVPFIHKNIRSKHLPLDGSSFVHFDSHPDMLIPNMPADYVFDKDKLIDNISIENWMMPLVYAGHFNHLVWIKPPWAHQIEDGSQWFNIGKDKDEGGIKLDCKENYFVSECLYRNKSGLENVKNVQLDIVTLGNGLQQQQDDYSKISGLLSKSDMYWVLDVDLDYFSTGNPFKRMYEKGDLYTRLKEIYYFSPPSSKEDDLIIRVSGQRKKQIEYIRGIFEHLEKHRVMPQYEENDLYKKINDLQTVLLEHYDDKDIDWLLIHDAGCTCDETDLPEHISTNDELEVMFSSFKNFLEVLPSNPVIITISRSTEDDYTPFESVELIQDRVIGYLNEKFSCDEPVMDYLDKISN